METATANKAFLSLGAILQTRAINERCATDAVFSYRCFQALKRHARLDDGDLDEADKAANREALKTGDRILSAYNITADEKIWIITEGDRSLTTIIFPEDY